MTVRARRPDRGALPAAQAAEAKGLAGAKTAAADLQKWRAEQVQLLGGGAGTGVAARQP